MFKYKKIAFSLSAFLYIVVFIIELIKYMIYPSSIYGLIYLINNLFIILLLIPCAYNYKKYYSFARITKLIIILLFGIFNSYLLGTIVINNIGVTDYSKEYMKSIFVYRSILKGLVYFILGVITIFEFKKEKLLKSISFK